MAPLQDESHPDQLQGPTNYRSLKILNIYRDSSLCKEPNTPLSQIYHFVAAFSSKPSDITVVRPQCNTIITSNNTNEPYEEIRTHVEIQNILRPSSSIREEIGLGTDNSQSDNIDLKESNETLALQTDESEEGMQTN